MENKVIILITLLLEINENPNFQKTTHIIEIEKLVKQLELSELESVIKEYKKDYQKNKIKSANFLDKEIEMLYNKFSIKELRLQDLNQKQKKEVLKKLDKPAKWFVDYFESL